VGRGRKTRIGEREREREKGKCVFEIRFELKAKVVTAATTILM
jgi:hypothetical protein